MFDRIIIVGIYAEPEPVGGNSNIARQALALQGLGKKIEILTWPHNDSSSGPTPNPNNGNINGIPYLKTLRSTLNFHVVSCPRIWSERVLTKVEWEAAVDWGMAALDRIKPRLVHLQFWQNLW